MLATALFACGTAVTNTGVTGGGTASGGGDFSGLWVVLGALAVYAAAVAIVTVTLIVIAARHRVPRPVPVPVGAALSPDGHYWWDGTAWRPVTR